MEAEPDKLSKQQLVEINNMKHEEEQRELRLVLLERSQFKAHLLSVCSALGATTNGLYTPGDEVLDCLKDIKRYLKDEEGQEPRLVFTCLADWGILQEHFIPLLQYSQDKVFSAVGLYITITVLVEILVPLTWPLEGEGIVTYNKQMQSMKPAFLKDGIFKRILAEMMKILSKRSKGRTDRESAQLRMMLFLFRNILAIRDGAAGINVSLETVIASTMQEQIVESMYIQNVMEMLNAFAGSMDEPEYSVWNVALLEIIHFVVCDRDPAEILHGGTELKTLMAKEKKANPTANTAYTRHSRFGGCLTLISSTGKRMIAHNSLPNIEKVMSAVDSSKKQKQIRIREEYRPSATKSFLSSRGRDAYRQFCLSLLDNGFNSLMLSLKKDIDSEKEKIKEEHYLKYFATLRFFLKLFLLTKEDDACEFNTDFDCVTSLLTVRNIMFIHRKINNYLDEKKKQYLHFALEALLEVMKVLTAMLNSPNDEYRSMAKTIQIVRSCKNEPLLFLELLIETIHVQLKMLENYSKARTALIVRKKRKTKTSDGLDEEDIEIQNDEGGSKYVEKAMRFDQIEAALIEVYLQALASYATLKSRTLKCIVTMFHRIFVKVKLEPLFYRLSTLSLFNNILADAHKLEDSHKELLQFVTYAVKKLLVNINEYPILLTEILFSKSKRDCLRIMDREYDVEVYTSTKRKEAVGSDEEIEIKKGVPWREQIGTIVTIMRKIGRGWMVDWLVQHTSIERSSLDIEETDFHIPRATIEHGKALDSDNKFELLMRLLFFNSDQVDGSMQKMWLIPSTHRPYQLDERVELLEFYIKHPFEPDSGKPVEALLRKKKVKNPKAIGETRKRKIGERVIDVKKSLLSEELIEDSDDFDDTEFFIAEASRRKLNKQLYGTAVVKARSHKIPATLTDQVHVNADIAINEDESEASDKENVGLDVDFDNDKENEASAREVISFESSISSAPLGEMVGPCTPFLCADFLPCLMMGSSDKIEFENIYHKGSLGKLKIAEMGLGWKDASSGAIITVPGSEMESACYLRAARLYQLEIQLTNNKKIKLDNFPRESYDELKTVLREFFKLELIVKELSIRGWNWGRTEFNGSDMSFMVANAPAFEIPLSEVASTSLASKNEVSLEFATAPPPTAGENRSRRAEDSLVEIRFYVPGMATRDQFSIEDDEDEQLKENKEEGEINTDLILGKDGEAMSAAALFHDTIRERGDVGTVQGESIVSFADLLCLTPRGRFEVELHDGFFRLRGKSHDYKILFTSISKMMLVRKTDDLFWMFVIGLEPPLRQGQTKYPFLVFQFAKEDEVECTLKLSEEQTKKYEGKLEKSYDAPAYEVVSEVFAGLTSKAVLTSKFKSSQGLSGIKCSVKANEAMLYPLDRYILSIPKPPTLLSLNQIVQVTFSRVGGGLSSTKTFEVKFSMDNGIQHSYSSIPREDFPMLQDYCVSKKLNVENEMENEGGRRFDDDIGDDSDENSDGEPASRKRVRAAVDFAGAGGNDDDESSVDEDFVAEKKVASDESSSASSSDEDMAEAVPMEDFKEISGGASSEEEDVVKDKGKSSSKAKPIASKAKPKKPKSIKASAKAKDGSVKSAKPATTTAASTKVSKDTVKSEPKKSTEFVGSSDDDSN